MSRARPYLLLALLWGLYFHPLVLHPTQTLYADFSDFLAEHLPARVFLVREWRTTGELPLWNPYHFCGSPFVHDIQVGTFYPPYAVTLLFPESAAGAVVSWVIALHLLAGGAFTFVYCRANGMGEVGGLVAAVGFMLSAKWLTHLLLAGHTITAGLAWLPLVLLGLERGIRTRRVWPVVGAGAAFALVLLGTHPQWSFYAGLFAAAWTFGAAERTRAGVVRWLGCGLGAVAVAVLLAAVQLLPTVEASRYSSRAAGMDTASALQVGLFALFGLVGPSSGFNQPNMWEVSGVFGLFWLVAAAAAPSVVGGRARWWAWVLVGVLVFSLGGAALVDWLPGFNLFRAPTRMLLIAAFPVAVLAGATTDALVRTAWAEEHRRKLGRMFVAVGLFAAVPAVMCLTIEQSRPEGPAISVEFVAFWAAETLGIAGFLGLVLSARGDPRLRTGCWLAILLAELVTPVLTFPAVRPQADIYPTGGPMGFLREHARPGEWRVIDIDTGTGPGDRLGPLGGGSPLSMTAGVETVRGYNPLDVRHYREYVGFVLDQDREVVGLSPVAQPVIPNFPRTNRPLFDLLNARYLACFPEYISNEELRKDPGHRVDSDSWRGVVQVVDPPAVPALPPKRPERLPPVVIVENLTVRPRAFVVSDAARMPAGDELAALKGNNFGRTVLLTTDESLPANGTQPGRPVRVVEYRANRVRLDLGGGPGGFLVLSDVWFPGWECELDGHQVPVYRANHAFRAVAVPDGATEAVFAFEPRSYRIGWWVSTLSLALLSVSVVFALVTRRWRNSTG
ncbi:MAG: YfhO family protein [Gemmataceae bacterium]|nr:YfhO family protein [Gemmataceae bacterium]